MTNKSRTLPMLDEYCRKILLVLIIVGDKIRFNSLNEFLGQNGTNISKPTLSKHLKHLKEKKFVIQKVEGVQKVSYEINHKKLGAFEQTVKSAFREHLNEDKIAFETASVDDQMDYVFLEAAGRILRKLKLNIELSSDPVSSLEKSLELMLLSSPFFEHYEEYLLEKSEKNEEYRGKILEKINGLIKEMEEKK